MESLERQFLEGLKVNTSGHEAKPSNSVREYSTYTLPVDLLIEIFSRVPLKSIARFRCVSKIWASILRRSDFTEEFLNKSLTRPRLLFTVKSKGKLLFYSPPQPHNPDHNYSTPSHTSFPEYIPCDYCKMVCGLVLLEGYRKRKVRVICNPATGQFLTLPKILLKEKKLPKVKAKSNPTEIAGIYLGYDPVGKQFKVLCMTSSDDERPNTHQVLTLESGKRLWRLVKHKFHFVKNHTMRGEICIDGVLYFGAVFGESSVIVCFNVQSEKFSFVNTNEDMGLECRYVCGSLTIFNYNGKLGIHQRHTDYCSHAKELVLWVLEDVGTHIWSKRCYVLPPSRSKIVTGNRFLGMSGTGEFVYSLESGWSKSGWSWNSRIFFYNIEKNTVKRVNIQGLEGPNETRRICRTFVDYVENLKFM